MQMWGGFIMQGFSLPEKPSLIFSLFFFQILPQTTCDCRLVLRLANTLWPRNKILSQIGVSKATNL